MREHTRLSTHTGERETWPFDSSFYMFFPLLGPALCKLSQHGVLFVLSEVLNLVLGPSFDLPLFYFHGLFPSVSLLLLLLTCFSRVRLCATPQMAAHQTPPSLGFSRQEHWSGLPFLSPMHESEVTQSCPALSDPMDRSLPGSSVHGIFQAKVLEWGAIAFSQPQPFWTPVSYSNYLTFPPQQIGGPILWLLPAELGRRGVLGLPLLLVSGLRVLIAVSI